MGRPRIVTLDLDIELAFGERLRGAVTGELVGTTLGAIGARLRDLRVEGRAVRFELPNWQPRSFTAASSQRRAR